MRVRVLFFGQLREIVGASEEETELSEGSKVEDLFERYGRRFPELAAFRSSSAVSINREYAAWRAALSSGDEVAFLPPVSGGQHAAQTEGRDVLRLTHEAIRIPEIVKEMKAPECGGLVAFDGFVRDNFKGRKTLYLEYEAYEPMALEKMREIVATLRARFGVSRVAMVHRLGRLEVGETSVVIAVSAPHRAAAFDACRYAIDTLKHAVPIWKKEFFADGSVWAEGETPAQEAFSARDES